MVEYTDRDAFLNDIKERYCLPFEEEDNMEQEGDIDDIFMQ